ncbi:ABC transporter substrate-binding protein [Aquamicrobium sp. LC103]|uniref:ABC transporter substrate-binding protein n=1 Tax=Aquamicrobium sp. LC103 TaxID=1120658 RepID=UPI00063EC1A8|nr:ABC transporter substrate-binding protein [Aquamicrobium sp. LC103]TKT76194.1 amino acid ABC transporter substrate-binding protein [Aquamicrobium sp. LC103]
MNRRHVFALAASALLLSVSAPAFAQETVKIANISELSGPGATSGVNWRDGAAMAIEEINAGGGILGKQVQLSQYDSQSDAQTSRAMVQKAIDEGAFALLGTVYSGSTIVNMLVAQQAGIPQMTGSEAPKITQLGNPYIFRTSFGAQKSMPKIAAYLQDEMKVTKVAVAWVNTEFGKGGHDAFVAEMKERGIEIVADVPSENAQADFAADVVKLKGSGAEAIFVYLTEEESARFLREARKQGISVPLVGETTLIGQKVIDLAGEASNGALGHVSLTPDAPVPAVQEMAKKFEEKYKYRADHNAIKGYIGAYAIKYATEAVGELDSQKVAEKLHGLTLKAAENPGILIDISWDETGEVSRESYLVEVKDGKQTVKATLPAN